MTLNPAVQMAELFGHFYKKVWPRMRSMKSSTGGGKAINTSFIERFNATMRERLAALTRRCRHASQRLEAVQWGM
jgi:IS1 family transposase